MLGRREERDRLLVPGVPHVGSVNGGAAMKQGYRLVIVDKDGVLVSEFQLTETALAQPEAFVEALRQSIEHVEEEEP